MIISAVPVLINVRQIIGLNSGSVFFALVSSLLQLTVLIKGTFYFEIWFYRYSIWWSIALPFDHKSNEYVIWNILQGFQVDKIQEAESVEAGDYIAWNVSGIKNK